MEPVFAFLANGWAYLSQHVPAFVLLLATYTLLPSLPTKFFAWLEEQINKIKVTVGGFTIDFSKYDWDDEIVNYLRDLVIAALERASKIKTGVASGEIDPQEGNSQLETILKEIVQNFLEEAPAYLKKYLEEKYGASKIAIAEYLFRKVQSILFDVETEKAFRDRNLRELSSK